MSKNTYPLKTSTSVKKAAAELAASDGVSLNQFIAAAVAEKVVPCAQRMTSAERAGMRNQGHAQISAPAPKAAPNADDTL